MIPAIFKRPLQRSVLLLAGALLFMGSTACQGGGGPTPAPAASGGERLSVVTSIHPLEYFVMRIGDDVVEVTNLVSPGVEAHGFEPSASDLQRLAAADMVVMNGLELEPWLERSLSALGESAPAVVIEAADLVGNGLLPLEDDGHEREREREREHEHEREHGDEHVYDAHQHDEFDPHVWLDPLLAVVQVERIRDAMIDLAPQHTDLFRANAQSLIDDLRGLHGRFESTLSSCVHDRFVVTHSAYAYLSARHGLEQIAIAGLTPEAEPSAQRLAQIADEVRALGLRYILVEPVLGARLGETMRREVGVELLPIHQIESITLAELSDHRDYMGLMENNLRSLSTALECGP